MSVHPDERQALRRYLLGEAADEDEARRVEHRLLSDDLFFEELGAAEDELIDDYLDGSLAPAEREKFALHFLSTAERGEKLAFARHLFDYLSKQTTADTAADVNAAGDAPARPRSGAPAHVRTSRLGSSLKIAAAALLLVGACYGVWRYAAQESELDRGLRLLAQAQRDRRTTEARVSGLAHARLDVTRGPGATDPAQTAAEAQLRVALDEDPGPAARHALGRALLAAGRPDEAVAELEAALKDAPADARLLSDLGAAYLERGRLAPAPGDAAGRADFSHALELFDRALALDASLPEAHFNRALAYERLRQPARAAQSWRDYLALDPSTPWADEARRRLDALDAPAP